MTFDKKTEELSTRRKILLTAIKQFAAKDISSVTLRRISAEAGCANTAAVHYHFGDRNGLLIAIVSFLDELVWQPGFARLSRVVEENCSLRVLLEAGLWPYKKTVFEFSWGADAQSFLFRLAQSGNSVAHDAFDEVREKHDDLFKKSVQLRLSDLEDDVFEQRWQFMMTEAVAGQWARGRVLHTGNEANSNWTHEREYIYLERFLDYAAGGLQAPNST